MKYKKGFTLIELLVVIAIIGILASVVIASLNSAREKGKVAAIKSNLKNMISQMELSFSDNNNYSGINAAWISVYRPYTVCLGPIANMAQSIKSAGGFSRCLSVNNSGWQDLSSRWGATGLIYSATAPVKAWSVSPQGVVTWDAQGVNSSGAFVGTDVSMNWDTAVAACATAGGRLPTIEELKTLADAQCEALGSSDCTVDSGRLPPGFASGVWYWSGTSTPSAISSTHAYIGNFYVGTIDSYPKVNSYYVHCVR